MTKVALVTGGTRGIGAAISIALKNSGCKVAATYGSNSEAADKFSSENGVEVFKWNVADPAACEDGVKQVVEKLGAVDILVNNAGITKAAMTHKMTIEQWDDVIRVDLDSVFYMTRCVLDGMREKGFGRIISISSINGQKGQMGVVNYSAAKAGVIGLTKSIAIDYITKGIRCNCICPGTVDSPSLHQRLEATGNYEIAKKNFTARQPMGRLATPEEIAALVVYLASDESAFTTGQPHIIDGGWSG